MIGGVTFGTGQNAQGSPLDYQDMPPRPRCPGSFADVEMSEYVFDGEWYHGTVECAECLFVADVWRRDSVTQVPKHEPARSLRIPAPTPRP